MLCKNCNNNLTGSEDYCPYCGTPQKFPDLKVTPSENKDTDKTSPAPSESSIFHSEPVYIYADPPQEKKDPKTKLTVVLVSLFLLTLLGVGIFSVSQYFNLTPAFSSLFAVLPTSDSETTILETTTEVEFDSFLGLVSPDINLKSTACTVTSEKGLPLRKGPDNAFAQIDTLSNGTSLQVIGKSLGNNLWVYAYVPSLDLYGWVSGSYICENSALSAPDTAEYTQTQTEKSEN